MIKMIQLVGAVGLACVATCCHSPQKTIATTLHGAASLGNISQLQGLLVTGADINATEADGMTPLMSAACNGQTEAVKILADKGADLELQDKNGYTALELAAYYGQSTIVTILMNKGAHIFSHQHTHQTLRNATVASAS